MVAVGAGVGVEEGAPVVGASVPTVGTSVLLVGAAVVGVVVGTNVVAVGTFVGLHVEPKSVGEMVGEPVSLDGERVGVKEGAGVGLIEG